MFGKIGVKLRSLAFSIFHRDLIFTSIPVILARWPIINNKGVMKFGRNCAFRNPRFPSALSAYSGAILEIGDNGFINEGVTICASLSILIGDNVKIGDNSYIYDTDFHPISPAEATVQSPVIIGNNVWIGANAMILAGAQIGDHAVVGAGSVVKGPIPARSIAVGNPAKVVKSFQTEDNWVRG